MIDITEGSNQTRPVGRVLYLSATFFHQKGLSITAQGLSENIMEHSLKIKALGKLCTKSST